MIWQEHLLESTKSPRQPPIGNSKLLKTAAFQEAAEKIRNETPGIIKNKSVFNPNNSDQKDFVEDIFAAQSSYN